MQFNYSSARCCKSTPTLSLNSLPHHLDNNPDYWTSPLSIILLIEYLPMVAATLDHNPFSDIPFKAFSKFIDQNFSSHVSLATALVVLFTITSNPDLFNLHARQQHPLQGECGQPISGWMKALA